MTKDKIKLLSALLALLSVMVLIISLTVFFASPKVTAGQVDSETEYQYILKEYEGKIAVFNYEDLSAEKVYDIYVSTLPEADRLSLKEGIKIKDDNELLKYIEDFDS